MQISLDGITWVTIWNSLTNQVSNLTKYNVVIDSNQTEIAQKGITENSNIFISWHSDFGTDANNDHRQNLNDATIYGLKQ